MKNAINDFLETETYSVDRGYTIHVSRAPEFATSAVVEDGDGAKTLVDVSGVNYEDFESFLDAVVEKYESNQVKNLYKENWKNFVVEGTDLNDLTASLEKDGFLDETGALILVEDSVDYRRKFWQKYDFVFDDKILD